MPVLSRIARRRKIDYFLKDIPGDARILEVGCSDGWLGRRLTSGGWNFYRGLDLAPPADILGSIREWRSLDIAPESQDVIIAFEVIEHIDCAGDFYDILKPGGILCLTSPLPHMDWFCRILELGKLCQKRTSRHSNLLYFRDLPYFEIIDIRNRWFTSQWGRFRKPGGAPSGGRVKQHTHRP